MGLSADELEERREDRYVNYIADRVCKKDSGKPYVFVSYKSDDWKLVLRDIVYKLVKDYGLNVYFDGEFNGHNPLWTEQFPDNMRSPNCRGVLAFVDDQYTCSYATLMELLYSQAGCQEIEPPYNYVKKNVVPVFLSKLTLIKDKANTGLGVGTFDNGEVNIHAADEKNLFDELFVKASELHILKNTVNPYKWAKELSKELCATMTREVLAFIGANDNLYQQGIQLKDIAKSIEDACGREVFSGSTVPREKSDESPAHENESTETTVAPEKIVSGPSLSEGNLWTYSAKGAVAYIEWDGESKDCIVKKGSKVAAESNGFAKLAPAKKMKDILLQKGIIVNNEFVVDYSCDKISTMINVLTGGSVSMPKAIKDGVLRKGEGKESADSSNDKFVYSIWGETHTSNSLADMMHDVFDFITAKYPEKVDAMAHDISITAVALKSDVDGNRLPSNKMNYFKAKKEHTVDGRSYYVSTRYNREQGIGQLKKMLELCEGNADAFVIVSEPKKSVHSGKSVDSGKKGLGELL